MEKKGGRGEGRGTGNKTKQNQPPLQYGRMIRDERSQYQAKGENINTRGLNDINAVVLLRRQGMLEYKCEFLS